MKHWKVLGFGVEIRMIGINSQRCILHAIMDGLDIVEKLWEKRVYCPLSSTTTAVDINGIAVDEECHGYTPLHIACEQRHFAVVKMYLQHPNTNVNARTFPWKFTPLQLVCQDPKKNLWAIVQELLNHPQIDIMTVDSCGGITLHTACIYQKRDEIVEKILLHKSGQYKFAQLNAVSRHGRTPLHCACLHSRNDALVRLLMDHANEMNINAMNFEGSTPLHIIYYRVKYHITPDGLNLFLYMFQQLC
jgi:ankyrin repeat protein